MQSKPSVVPCVGTFSEYVGWMATNAPHAVVMDWWRRLELALREYFDEAPGRLPVDRAKREELIELDSNFGEAGRALLHQLRKRRNEVAHESGQVSRDEAVRFAQDALRLIGALGFRRPLAESARLPVA